MLFRFSITYKTSHGEHLHIAGSAEELGRWDTTRAPVMTWTPGHVWVVYLEIQTRFEYKYFVSLAGNAGIRWEECANREERLNSNPYSNVSKQDVWAHRNRSIDSELQFSTAVADGALEPARALYQEPYVKGADSGRLGWLAIQCGKVQMLQFLLSHGLDPNSEYDGRSLLHHAVASHNVDATRLLLASGAVQFAMDKDGRFPRDFVDSSNASQVFKEFPANVQFWGVDDVAKFLKAIRLGHAVDKFRDNRMEGDMLLSFDAQDFQSECGLTKEDADLLMRVLHRIKSYDD